MSKIIDAVDILDDAKSCAQCIFMAAHDLDDETGPIQIVANIVRWKITEAIALLDEYRTEIRLVAAGDKVALENRATTHDASPISDSPAAEPVSSAPRPKRSSK